MIPILNPKSKIWRQNKTPDSFKNPVKDLIKVKTKWALNFVFIEKKRKLCHCF
jgi:hypothetical protein